MEDSNSTYLEDFLQSLENLPNSFRRECELMKELDREVFELSNDIAKIESIILLNVHRLKESSQRSSPKKSNELSGEVTFTKDDEKMDIDTTSQRTIFSPTEIEQLKQDNEQLLRDRALLCSVAWQKIHDKKAIAKSVIEMINQFEHKLDTDLGHFEQDLKHTGDYEAPSGIPPNSEVAVKLTIDSQDKTLILAQVQLFRSESNSYEIIDVDDQQKYTLPDSQVFELGQAEALKKFGKGDHVFALYPDTTIFYPATVLSAPKRLSSSSSNTMTADSFSLPVQFHGDEDNDGNIPIRSIPLKYIVRAPQFM
jgi:hypothetical protein